MLSDIDGTMTKQDEGGLARNLCDIEFLHDDFTEFIFKINKNGYKLVWTTMRSLPLYKCTKRYLKTFAPVDAPLII